MVRKLDTIFISREAIKPSSSSPSPTPHLKTYNLSFHDPHLKTYNLSFHDNFISPVHIPLVFFYPYNDGIHKEKAGQLLKKSLSQTLIQYYPFAGRLVPAVDGPYVDCNDEGVEFEEARVNAQLFELVNSDCQSQSLDQFFPTRPEMGSTAYSCLVKVKLTYFECGGLGLGVSLCHKIGDTCTLFSFINHWAAMNQSHCSPDIGGQRLVQQPLPPHLISSEKYVCAKEAPFDFAINRCISKKFIFTNSKLEQLKAEVGIKDPTRVEVVTSLLYLCATRAVKANKGSNFYKTFILIMSANLRQRMANIIPETTVGNLSWSVRLINDNDDTDDELALNTVADQIKKGKSKLNGITISQLNLWQKEALASMNNLPRNNMIKSFSCTSLCGYPLYRVDFGLGKPVRVAFPGADDLFVLMETPNGDGIEAVVSLEEEEMAKFQVDEQLLKFAFAA